MVFPWWTYNAPPLHIMVGSSIVPTATALFLVQFHVGEARISTDLLAKKHRIELN